MEEGVCWWSLSGGNMLVVTWRREYVGGPMEEGRCWWSPWKGRGICWDCGKILVSYYAQCEKNFCKKKPPPPLSCFWLDVLGDPGRGGESIFRGSLGRENILGSPYQGNMLVVCWDCRILLSYYAQCKENFCKKKLAPPPHTQLNIQRIFFLKFERNGRFEIYFCSIF